MAPARLSLLTQIWSFIKETYLNGEVIGRSIRSNKLSTLLILTNMILFIMVMFITEQTMQRQKLLTEARAQQKDLVTQNARLGDENLRYQECFGERKAISTELATVRNQISMLESDYRTVNQALSVCNMARVAQTPIPPQKPAPRPTPHVGPEPPRNTGKHRNHQTALDNIPE